VISPFGIEGIFHDTERGEEGKDELRDKPCTAPLTEINYINFSNTCENKTNTKVNLS